MRFVLSYRERHLILSKDVCRLSTISPNGWPHSVLVGYVYLHGKFYVPSSRQAKKVRNLAKNPKATMVIDDERTERGAMVECSSKVLDGGGAEPFREYMRRVKGWNNDENTVVIELSPLRKASWCLR